MVDSICITVISIYVSMMMAKPDVGDCASEIRAADDWRITCIVFLIAFWMYALYSILMGFCLSIVMLIVCLGMCGVLGSDFNIRTRLGSGIDRIPAARSAIEMLEHNKTKYSNISEKAKEMDICIICTEKFDEETEVCELGCDERHIFHAPCIVRWMETSTTCPVCRKPVKPIEP